MNQYQSATVYQRGAQTLQALRQRIGDEKFFNTLRATTPRSRARVAETQDFVAIAQRESGEDLRDFFKQWLYTPGKPTEPYCYCYAHPGQRRRQRAGDARPDARARRAAFEPFTPGVEKEYTASTTATVTSTAADATLSVCEPGNMTNGAFSLPEPLRIELSKSTWTGPVSNDVVAVTAKQRDQTHRPAAHRHLSQTVTFTLSTTQP